MMTMIKKTALLILMMLFITGCDAIYSLDLQSDQFNETLEVNNHKKATWDSKYKNIIDLISESNVATDYREEKPESNEKIVGLNYYDISKISNDNNLGLKYNHNFTISEYKYSSIVFSNANLLEYNYNKDIITINNETLKSFNNYPDLNNLTIKFITNHDVINNNADEIKNNEYYWYFNKANANTKKIILEVSRNYKEDKLKILELDESGYFGESTIISFYLIILFIISIIGVGIFFKIRNSNR